MMKQSVCMYWSLNLVLMSPPSTIFFTFSFGFWRSFCRMQMFESATSSSYWCEILIMQIGQHHVVSTDFLPAKLDILAMELASDEESSCSPVSNPDWWSSNSSCGTFAKVIWPSWSVFLNLRLKMKLLSPFSKKLLIDPSTPNLEILLSLVIMPSICFLDWNKSAASWSSSS